MQQFEAGAPSHTGRILKGVLAAGPHAERAKFDPKAAAARPSAGDMDIAEVGKDAEAAVGGRRPALAHHATASPPPASR